MTRISAAFLILTITSCAGAQDSMRLDHVEWQLFVGPRQRSRPRTAFEILGPGSVCSVSAVQSEVRDGFTLETRDVSCAMSDSTSVTGQARCAFRGNDVVEAESFQTSFPHGERSIRVLLGCSSFPVLDELRARVEGRRRR